MSPFVKYAAGITIRSDCERARQGLESKLCMKDHEDYAMLQVIGLIVAVYAMVRVVQVPIEMTSTKEEWLGLPFTVRFFILAGISAAGLLVLGILTLMLLASGSDMPGGF